MDDLLRQSLSVATLQLAEKRHTELGMIALKSAGIGTGFFFTTTFQNRRDPESKARAIVIAACGDLPDDLLLSMIRHTKATLQDYVHGNPNIRQIHKEESPDED
jgi:hypothetical protein